MSEHHFVNDLTEFFNRHTLTNPDDFDMSTSPNSYASSVQPPASDDTWIRWTAQSNCPPAASPAQPDQAHRPVIGLPAPHFTPQRDARVASQRPVQQATALPTATLLRGSARAKTQFVGYDMFREDPAKPIVRSAASVGSSQSLLSPLPGRLAPVPMGHTVGQHSSAPERSRSQPQPEHDDLVKSLHSLSLRTSELERTVNYIAARFTPPSSTDNRTDDGLQVSSTQESTTLRSDLAVTGIDDLSHGDRSYGAPPHSRGVAVASNKDEQVPRETPFARRRHESALENAMLSVSGLDISANPVSSPHESSHPRYVVPPPSRDRSAAEYDVGHFWKAGFGYADHHAAWIARYDVAQRAQIDDLQTRLRVQDQYMEQYHAQVASQHAAQVQAYFALEYWYNMQALEFRAAHDRIANLERVRIASISQRSTPIEPQKVGGLRAHYDKTADLELDLTRECLTSGFGQFEGAEPEAAQRGARFSGCNALSGNSYHGQQHIPWLHPMPQGHAGIAKAQIYPETHRSTTAAARSAPSLAIGVHGTSRSTPASEIDSTIMHSSARRLKLTSGLPYPAEMDPHASSSGSMSQLQMSSLSLDQGKFKERLTVPVKASSGGISQATSASSSLARPLQPWVEDDGET